MRDMTSNQAYNTPLEQDKYTLASLGTKHHM